MSFAELSAMSNFTFLTGASHPEEYVDRAALLGLSAIAIADVNSVAGVVRGHARVREIARQVKERLAGGLIGPPAPMKGWEKERQVFESYPGGKARRKNGTLASEELEGLPGSTRAAIETGTEPAPLETSAAILNVPRLIPGARITLDTGFSATALPKTRKGWGNLCRLISCGRLRAEKGDCLLYMDDLVEFGAELALLIHPPEERSSKSNSEPGSPPARRRAQRLLGKEPPERLAGTGEPVVTPFSPRQLSRDEPPL